MLDPEALPDKRTEAEKKHEEHMRKYEQERARKAAKKSHRDRIKVGPAVIVLGVCLGGGWIVGCGLGSSLCCAYLLFVIGDSFPHV